jgi:hypothetical protein
MLLRRPGSFRVISTPTDAMLFSAGKTKLLRAPAAFKEISTLM